MVQYDQNVLILPWEEQQHVLALAGAESAVHAGY